MWGVYVCVCPQACVCVCVRIFVCLWLSLGGISNVGTLGSTPGGWQSSCARVFHPLDACTSKSDTLVLWGSKNSKSLLLSAATLNLEMSFRTTQVTLWCLAGSWKQKGRLQCTLPTDPVAPAPWQGPPPGNSVSSLFIVCGGTFYSKSIFGPGQRCSRKDWAMEMYEPNPDSFLLGGGNLVNQTYSFLWKGSSSHCFCCTGRTNFPVPHIRLGARYSRLQLFLWKCHEDAMIFLKLYRCAYFWLGECAHTLLQIKTVWGCHAP